jgi:hypothetical protein
MNQLYRNGILLMINVCGDITYLRGLLFKITCTGYAQVSSFWNSMCCFPYAFMIVPYDSSTIHAVL